MRIIIIGAGGVGGYFGGKLAAAGFNTGFLVRGKTLKAIKANGLRVKSIAGDFHVYPEASEDYEIIKKADLIVLSVKSWQIDKIATELKPLMNRTAVVLPLQNGADNADRLVEILGRERVLAGLCRIVAKIDSPGIIDHFGYEPEILFGEIDNSKSERVQRIHRIFTKAGFKNKISDDIQRDIWLKFLFIASISAMGALTRSVLGVMREDPYIRSVLINTANEIVLVGQALGIDIHDQDIENCFAIIDKIDYQTTMSLQRDMMQEKPSELDNFNGYIVRQGDKFGIDTPTNDFIYYSLKPMENAARNLRN